MNGNNAGRATSPHSYEDVVPPDDRRKLLSKRVGGYDVRERTEIDGRKPLRILRIAQSVYPEAMGGVEVHVDKLSRAQAEAGHDVTVLVSDSGDRPLPRRETRDGYTLIRHTELARPFDNSIAPGIIRSILERAGEYDIIDIHSHLYFASNTAALIGAVSDTPVVVTNHGLVSQTAPGWIQTVFNRTIGRLTFEAADRIICLSETDQRRLRTLGVDVPVTVVPNGVDTDLFSPNPSFGRKKKLLFVGRLTEGKGPQYLLNAFASILDTHPEYSLTLIGDGPIYDDLVDLTEELMIGERVTFDSNLPIQDLVRQYNESQLFVLPSLSEGLPRTVLEALACETPVVVTKLEQLLPLVGGVGETVEPKSPQQLVEKIRRLLDDDSRRQRLGEAGRRRIISSYTWKRTVDETTSCYYEVA